MLRVNWPVSILNWFQLESLCWTFFFQKLSKFWVSSFVRRTVVDKVLTNLWRWSLFFHETSVLTFLGRFTDFGRRKKEFSLLLNVSTPGKCCSGKKTFLAPFYDLYSLDILQQVLKFPGFAYFELTVAGCHPWRPSLHGKLWQPTTKYTKPTYCPCLKTTNILKPI